MRRAGSRGGGVFAGAGGVIAVIATAVTLVLRLAPLDDPARPDAQPDLEGFAPEVTEASEAAGGRSERADAGALFRAAARALRDAGTYAYSGSVVAPGASNGTTSVDAKAGSLSVEELVELVTTLGPYDPASQPYLVAPPGTPVLGGEPR